MSHVLANLTPSVAHLTWLAALAVIAAAYCMIGGAVAGRGRLPEADLVGGWAVAASAVTLVGITARIGISRVDDALLVVAVAAAATLWRRERRLFHPGWARLVVLAVPMIALVAAMQPSQWDEFTNWLPNARYLFEVDGFPSRAGPPSVSVFPAYPYGLVTPIAHASHMVGRFADNTGALFNVALLLAFALLIARLIALGTERPIDERRGPGWGFSALVLLAVTVLSPTFVPKIAFTAYADLATAICAAFAAVLLVYALGALAEGGNTRARSFAWQAGLALTMLVLLKQVNVVHVGAIVLGTALAAWRDPRVGLRRVAALALPALLLPAVLYGAWQVYTGIEIPGGALTVRPLDKWLVDLIPQILAQMAYVLSKKGGYLGLMLVAVVLGARALRHVSTPFERLSIVAATAFLGYNAFLFVSYLAVFGANDAVTAGSFWRYNMHLGGIALAFAALGGAILWRRWGCGGAWLRPLGIVAVVLAVAWPVAGATKLRFDVRAPKLYVRAVAGDIAPLLKPADTLAVIDASGFGTYPVMMRYELLGRPAQLVIFETTMSVAEVDVRQFLDSKSPGYAWVHVPTPAIEAALGVKMAPRASYLLRRDGAGWREVKSWPYPGYELPVDAN